MKLNTNISLENVMTIIVLIGSMTLAFGFMKAEINYIQDILELKVDKEVIELKLDIIHAELIDLKEMIIEKENK
jgi:hypothetical protein|tara:strand:+ start:1282 stop:1503 length:222 start_codon:yes stop_codon:yes gene_type:complete